MRSAEKSVYQRFVKLRNGGIDESNTESALHEGSAGGGCQAGRGSGASEASRWLSIPLKTLANWLRASKAGKFVEVEQQEKPQADLEAKLHRVKRERLQKDLADHRVAVGIHRIKRLQSKLGLHCKQKHKFKARTDHGCGALLSPDCAQWTLTYADRGYDHDKYRRLLHAVHIPIMIARRGTPQGSGLGRWAPMASPLSSQA